MTDVFKRVTLRPPCLCPSEGHKYGVSIQSCLNLGNTLLLGSRKWETADAAIICHIPDSWLNLLNGCDFQFWSRDRWKPRIRPSTCKPKNCILLPPGKYATPPPAPRLSFPCTTCAYCVGYFLEHKQTSCCVLNMVKAKTEKPSKQNMTFPPTPKPSHAPVPSPYMSLVSRSDWFIKGAQHNSCSFS